MRRRLHPQAGISGGWHPLSPASRGGFTLLEMCLVLFIIALLGTAMMPAMQSAFVEQGLRKDAHQLSLMVKTAMLRSSEQNRPYVIELTSSAMSLHPASGAEIPAAATGASPGGGIDDTKAAAPAVDDVSISSSFESSNKLLGPDPRKRDSWIEIPSTKWVFVPGELCPAPRVRFSRGKAWLEMSFNALTGNVENESAYIP